MKKFFLIFCFVLNIFLLLSCGENTKDWPRISFPFNRESVKQIEILYTKDDINNDHIITDKEIIDDIYSVSFPYKEKVEKENRIRKWKIKMDIIFYLENYTFDKYEIVFYNCGITNGYVDFNGEEIHFLPADIGSYYQELLKMINEEK